LPTSAVYDGFKCRQYVFFSVLLYFVMMIGHEKFEGKRKIWWKETVVEGREGA
jgi:hypothetical protein